MRCTAARRAASESSEPLSSSCSVCHAGTTAHGSASTHDTCFRLGLGIRLRLVLWLAVGKGSRCRSCRSDRSDAEAATPTPVLNFSVERQSVRQNLLRGGGALGLRLPDITHKLARAATAGVTQHAAPRQHHHDVVILGAFEREAVLLEPPRDGRVGEAPHSEGGPRHRASLDQGDGLHEQPTHDARGEHAAPPQRVAAVPGRGRRQRQHCGALELRLARLARLARRCTRRLALARRLITAAVLSLALHCRLVRLALLLLLLLLLRRHRLTQSSRLTVAAPPHLVTHSARPVASGIFLHLAFAQTAQVGDGEPRKLAARGRRLVPRGGDARWEARLPRLAVHLPHEQQLHHREAPQRRSDALVVAAAGRHARIEQVDQDAPARLVGREARRQASEAERLVDVALTEDQQLARVRDRERASLVDRGRGQGEEGAATHMRLHKLWRQQVNERAANVPVAGWRWQQARLVRGGRRRPRQYELCCVVEVVLQHAAFDERRQRGRVHGRRRQV
eukprot:scaffold1535_cov61-Phaeocystis_antarctica.AAC.1